MEKLNLLYGDVIVCDPCYIKRVSCKWGGEREDRFDGLRLVKSLHEGDDGEFDFKLYGKEFSLGVDSGRVWAMKAEFGIEVEIDAGLSGYTIIQADEITAYHKAHPAKIEEGL